MGDTSPQGRQDTAEESQNPCLAHHFSPTVSSHAGSGGRHVHSGGFQKLPSWRWGRRRWRQAQTGPALGATPFSTHPTGHPGLYTHRAPRPPESPGASCPHHGLPLQEETVLALSPKAVPGGACKEAAPEPSQANQESLRLHQHHICPGTTRHVGQQR